LWELYDETNAFSAVLAAMEENGIAVDTKIWQDVRTWRKNQEVGDYDLRLRRQTFNINSRRN